MTGLRGRGRHTREARDAIRGAFPAAALVALLAAALWAAAAARPAAADISDPDAEPSHSFVVDGAAHADDGARDVVIASGVTYVAGEGRYGSTGTDATLTRIAHATWTMTTRHYDSRFHGDDTAVAVALGPDGAVYTAGTSTGAASNDLLVVKWSKAGNVVWARRYDGPVKGNDGAVDIAVDRAGNVVALGHSQGTTGMDWAVVSWTKKGARRYAWRYAGSGNFTDLPSELLIDADGRVYACGTVFVKGPKSAACVAKLSQAGAKRWVRTYTGPLTTGAAVYGIAADPAGGVFVVGYAENEPTGRDALVARFSAAGKRTGVGIYQLAGDDGPDVLTDVVVTKVTKRVIAVGYRSRMGEATDPIRSFIFRDTLAAASVQLFSSSDDAWYDVAADPFGGWVMAGSFGSTGTAFHTMRDSTLAGGATWRSQWESPSAGSVNSAWGVAARGGVVASVGRQYSGAATGYDQLVLFWVH